MTQRQTDPLRELSAAVIVAALRLYQWVISPLFPPACRFEPSCSHYAVQAVKLHGPWRGLALGLRRLSRCHPFTWLGGSSGFDPVPPLR